MNNFCTISTRSHLYKALALADSLQQGNDYVLHVLVVDGREDVVHSRCKFWYLSDLSADTQAQKIITKYSSNADKLRWSLKPVFMKHLLSGSSDALEKVIYVDNDIFFYNDYKFLFDLLEQNNFLLTPHYYRNDPRSHQNWFEANFRVGLYNAGFVGASKTAVDGLNWWAECCLYRCEKNIFRGLFDDQKYLDLLPVIDSKTHIVRHQGCNVAGWNTEVCKRVIVDNVVRINGEYPIVFIHYNDTTIREIVQGSDHVLSDSYSLYKQALTNYKVDLHEQDLLFNIPAIDSLKYMIWKILTHFGI